MIIAVASGFVFYLHQENQERVGLDAKETMNLYMERWQDQEYLGMLNIWYLSTFKKVYGEGFMKISEFREEEVTGIISIEQDTSWNDSKTNVDVYDQSAFTVCYQVLVQGKSYEHMITYILIQPTKNDFWYIAGFSNA
jgi:hypothetical protein